MVEWECFPYINSAYVASVLSDTNTRASFCSVAMHAGNCQISYAQHAMRHNDVTVKMGDVVLVRRAVVSVFNKSGLEMLATLFKDLKIEVLSTGA